MVQWCMLIQTFARCWLSSVCSSISSWQQDSQRWWAFTLVSLHPCCPHTPVESLIPLTVSDLNSSYYHSSLFWSESASLMLFLICFLSSLSLITNWYFKSAAPLSKWCAIFLSPEEKHKFTLFLVRWQQTKPSPCIYSLLHWTTIPATILDKTKEFKHFILLS